METSKKQKTVALLDAHALIHRSFHALPALTSPDGKPVGGLFGFSSMLIRLVKDLRPDYIAACFDLPQPTFRHQVYEKYKAHRPKTPTELQFQILYAREILKAFRIPVYEAPGFEADDVIATIVEHLSREGVHIVIASGDLDMLQLVRGDQVVVYTLKKGVTQTIIYDERAVRERFGFAPPSLPDFKALVGDPSDNIPGVKGIGVKTASSLIGKYGSIEQLYKKLGAESIKSINPRLEKLLKESENNAHFSKMLALARRDAPIEFLLEDARFEPNYEEVRKEFNKLGFKSLIARLPFDVMPAQKPTRNVQKLSGKAEEAMKMLTDAPGLALFLRNAELVFCCNGERGGVWTATQKDAYELRTFFRFISDKNIEAVSFEAKEIYKWLLDCAVDVRHVLFWDVQIAHWLLNPHQKNTSLDEIIFESLGSSADAAAPLALFDIKEKLESELDIRKLMYVFNEIEKPITPILASMEYTGIGFDADYAKRLGNDAREKLNVLEKEIYHLAGAPFNINSPAQLGEVLFDKLGIKPQRLKKTPGGARSTSASELKKLKFHHPIVAKLLSYREIAKLKSTYIDSLQELVAKDGRVHTKFHQTGTITGRLSSSDPNMQNLPIKSEFGSSIRKCFVAERGFLLVALDYSQIELRVAAHFSKDAKMMDAFFKDQDIHAITASEIHNIPIGEVSSRERRIAKIVNFGILYGMGVRSLAAAAGISQEQAEVFWQEYFHDFEGIADYIEKQKQLAVSCGYVETLFGRKRFLPDITSSNPGVRSAAERQAINFPIQGTATGDIIKLAMIQSQKFLREQFGAGMEKSARFLLQIHDELIFEIQEESASLCAKRLKEILENIVELAVPLKADVQIGHTLADLKL